MATRLTADQLVRQVIQGSGNMPAYGKNLSPGGSQRRSGVHGDVAARRVNHRRTDASKHVAMDPVAAAVLASWTIPVPAVLLLAVCAAIYLRGWLRLHIEMPANVRAGGSPRFSLVWQRCLSRWLRLWMRLAAFCLEVHMIQHLLLMMVRRL